MKKIKLFLILSLVLLSCSTESVDDDNINNFNNHFTVNGVEYSIEKCVLQKIVEGPDTYYNFVFGKSNLPNNIELNENYTYNGHLAYIGFNDNYIGNFNDTETYHDINYSSEPSYDYATWTEVSGSCSVSQNGVKYEITYSGTDVTGKTFILRYNGTATLHGF